MLFRSIPTMILTFGLLSLVMLIPHTFEWAHLSLIRKVDKLIDDYEKPFTIRFIQVLLMLTTVVVASPFFVWIGPKALYLHIKEKREKERSAVRDIQERLSEIRSQQERMADLFNGNGPEFRRQPKPDFLPKKKIMVHKLDQGIRKETFVCSGVYTRETDSWTLGEYEADYLRRMVEINLARARERYDRERFGRQVNHVRERMIDPWGGDNDNYRPIEYNEEEL